MRLPREDSYARLRTIFERLRRRRGGDVRTAAAKAQEVNRWVTLRKLFGPLCLCAFVVGFLVQMAAQTLPIAQFKPDRNAFTFTKYNLNLTIDPQTSLFTARGIITLRNDSPTPQSVIALQLGWQLKW